MSLVTIKDLFMSISKISILKKVSLEIGQEKFGLIGESGSGKSLLARTLLGLLPPDAEVAAATLSWRGKDLRKLREEDWRKIRGRDMTMILQDAKMSLHQLMTVRQQMQEVSGKTSLLSALKQVALSEQVLDLYPYQLSGGMGQRVMIAMMLMQHPQLLIADEVASALDLSLQKDIISLLQKRVDDEGMALLYISHDLELACQFCDRIGVMKDGELIVIATPAQLKRSAHPYVRRLFDAALMSSNIQEGE